MAGQGRARAWGALLLAVVLAATSPAGCGGGTDLRDSDVRTGTVGASEQDGARTQRAEAGEEDAAARDRSPDRESVPDGDRGDPVRAFDGGEGEEPEALERRSGANRDRLGERFRAAADSLCRSERRRLGPTVDRIESASGAGDASALAAAMGDLADGVARTDRRLRALQVPRGVRAPAAYLRAREQATRSAGRAARALAAGDGPAAGRALRAFESRSAQARAAGREYGFRVCGSG